MKAMRDSWLFWGITGFVFLLLLPLTSQYPTLEGDALEIVSAVETGGVIHSPGFPLYMVFAQLFALLFFFLETSHALALLSATSAALASGFAFSISRNLKADKLPSVVFAIIPTFAFEVWYQSLIVEVYSMAVLWMLLILHAFLIWKKSPDRKRWVWLSFVVFAGFPLHVYVWPMIPLALVFVGFVCWKSKINPDWLALILGFFIGLSPLAQLPLQAGNSRYVNEGNINSWSRFYDHVTWKLHRERLSDYEQARKSDMQGWGAVKLKQLEYFLDEAARQYLPPLLILLVAFVIVIILPFKIPFFTRGPPSWYHHSLFVFGVGLFLNIWLVFAGSDFNPSVLSEMKVHFVPVYYFISIWLALGYSLFKSRKLKISGLILTALFLVFHIGYFYSSMDLSENDMAVVHGEELLKSLPENTLLLSQGDVDLMSIIYLQSVKNFRQDVTLVNLVNGSKWYYENMRSYVEPTIWPQMYSKYFQLEVIEKNYGKVPIYFSNYYAALLVLQQPSMKGRFIVVPEKGGYKLTDEKRMLKESVDETTVVFSNFVEDGRREHLLREVELDISGQYMDYYSRRAELLSVFGKNQQAEMEWRLGKAQPTMGSKFNELIYEQLLKVQKRFNIGNESL